MAETYPSASSSSPSSSTPAAPAPRQSRPLCTTGPLPKPQLPPDVMNNPLRARALIRGRAKWQNKTVLHYAFFGAGSRYNVPKAQADAVRDAFAKWKAVGIGLVFTEVNDLSEAEVRIGYNTDDGSSASMVGKDVLNVPLNEPTTVYGWDLTTPYGRGTALHELGHVIGMEHEHQSPFAGIKWHEDAVYAALGGPPNNWSRETTFHNILEKLGTNDVSGSTWDPDSIMEYEFERGLIDEPEKYDLEGLTPPGTLSASDKEWALQWYPGEAIAPPVTELKVFQTVSAEIKAGEQRDYAFQPTISRRYTIATHGASDTLLTLFEEVDGEPRFVAGDDDSGEDRNAKIRQKLFKGRTYHVRLRLYWPGETGITAVVVT